MAILWGELVASEVRLMTADELFTDTRFAHGYELLHGRLIHVSLAGFAQGIVTADLSYVLSNFVRAHQLGTVVSAHTGFIVSQPDQPDTVLAPDIAFIRAEHVLPKGSPNRQKFQRLIPDLVVEVASPNQFAPEMASKAQYWLEVGVRLVWVVWPDAETIAVWRPGHVKLTLANSDTLDGYDVLPGFTHPIGDLF